MNYKYDIKGTETEKNLVKALQGEALAHLKYQFYKSKINDFSVDFAKSLDEIIHNEKEHGKIWFKILHDGAVPDNYQNLTDAISGEHYEFSEMYREFGDKAYEEGFDDIGALFYGVADIEGHHADEFSDMRDYVNEDKNAFLDDDLNTEWKCLNCGHIVISGMALDECPICGHPMKYFKKI